LSLRWVDKYVGIPFAKGGRNWGSPLDCGGLVRLVLEKEANIVLPALSCINNIPAAISALPPWTKVEQPKKFDVCLMVTPTIRGLAPLHIGVMVSENQILHIDEGSRSQCLSLYHPTISCRVETFYRHASLL
jgi:hypothetical protein